MSLTKDLKLLKIMWRDYLSRYRWKYPLVIFCMIVAGASTALSAKLIEPMVDKSLQSAMHDGDLTFIYLVGSGFFLLFALRGFASFGQIIILQRIAINVIEHIRHQIFSALQVRPLEVFSKDGTSKDISRFTNDVNVLVNNLSNIFVYAGRDFTTLLFLLGLLFYYDWLLTIIVIGLLSLMILPIRFFGTKVRDLSLTQQLEASKMVSVLDDNLKGIKHVRSYGLEIWQQAKMAESFFINSRVAKKIQLLKAWFQPISHVLLGAMYFFTLLFAGISISQGNLTTGQFISYLVVLMLLLAPIRNLTSVMGNFNEAIPALNRILELLDEGKKQIPLNRGEGLIIKNGTIKFDKISFRYPDGRKVFDNLTFTIPGKKMVALVGASGAGKTTLLYLIGRLFELKSGNILIDGQDIKKCSMKSLRKQIALVSQEQALFDVSIKENIAFGDLDANDTAIITAAKKAEAWGFIKHLPNGINTMAGELGQSLSGGQKQRIAIARAFLKNAPIILLDEVTSALDAKTESALQKTWQSILKGRTAIIIAHRLSTVKKADLILVLDKGKIKEKGTHQQLIKKNGLYTQLAKEQFLLNQK